MQIIDIYTTPFCVYCLAAKRLLKLKKALFHEIDLSKNPDRRIEMQKRSEGGRTVPQIFIGELYIGGWDELYQLEQNKKLDALLNAA